MFCAVFYENGRDAKEFMRRTSQPPLHAYFISSKKPSYRCKDRHGIPLSRKRYQIMYLYTKSRLNAFKIGVDKFVTSYELSFLVARNYVYDLMNCV
jgi:hypothetical protein